MRSVTRRVVVDPFLVATGSASPREYQPLQLRELGPIEAIMHSHPDRFHPGSLLRFPSQTLMTVPPVGRETIRSVAMEVRLLESGSVNSVAPFLLFVAPSL